MIATVTILNIIDLSTSIAYQLNINSRHVGVVTIETKQKINYASISMGNQPFIISRHIAVGVSVTNPNINDTLALHQHVKQSLIFSWFDIDEVVMKGWCIDILINFN